MAAYSTIEWTDHTFNAWEGCTKVSPGCDNCYAEKRNARFGGGVAVNWGPGAPRRRTSADNWGNPIKWQKRAAEFQAQYGRRQRVFCASLADVFDNEVPAEWRAALFALIASTPDLDWLLLTKRIGNVARMIEAPGMQKCGLPENVWLGATITCQEEADRDIPKLLAVSARVRFLSMEPLLGPVDLPEAKAFGLHGYGTHIMGVDWVIVGGESGPGARPMHPDWARNLRDQCAAAGVPFLFKQWGEWTPGENVTARSGTVPTATWFDQQWDMDHENLACEPYHRDYEPDLYRIGKKSAGRLLDGVEHNGFPEVRS